MGATKPRSTMSKVEQPGSMNGRRSMLVDYNSKYEKQILMPNEIFKDFLGSELARTPAHLGFAYAYYFMVTYLYRFCKYGSVKWTQPRIKEFLGYHKDNKRIDYIIKNGGVLDQLGYTESTTDTPIKWWYNGTIFDFYLRSNLKEDEPDFAYLLGNPRNKTIKFPVKAFHRTPADHEEGSWTGTLQDARNTHGIEVPLFIDAMENPGISTTGFYIYGFLKHKNDWHQGGYERSLVKLSEDIGIPERTLSDYLNNLDEYNYIKVDRQPFVIDLPENLREANTYTTKPASLIRRERKPKKQREVISYSTYKRNPFM